MFTFCNEELEQVLENKVNITIMQFGVGGWQG